MEEGKRREEGAGRVAGIARRPGIGSLQSPGACGGGSWQGGASGLPAGEGAELEPRDAHGGLTGGDRQEVGPVLS